MKSFPKSNSVLLLFSLSFLVVGCSRCLTGTYYNKDYESGREMHLSVYKDHLAVLLHNIFIGNENYYNTDYFRIQKVNNYTYQMTALDIDVNSIPFVLKRKKSCDSGIDIEICGVYPNMNWSLISSGMEMEVSAGESLHLPMDYVRCRLRGVMKCDSMVTRNDTVYTAEFELTDKECYSLRLDERLSGLPYYFKSLYDDTATLYSSSRVLLLERRNQILVRVAKKALLSHDILKPVVSDLQSETKYYKDLQSVIMTIKINNRLVSRMLNNQPKQ